MDIMNILKDRLKEEQWTRSTIENYSIKDLTLLDELLKQIKENGKKKEAHDFCYEFVKDSPKSLIGLYVLGCLSYELDDFTHAEALIQVVDFFKENKKWAICERILLKIHKEYEKPDVYTLKLLLYIYDNYIPKKDEEKKDLLSELVRQDVENGDSAKRLADYLSLSENTEDTKIANKYYRSALRRYAKNKNYSMVEQLWKKISATIDDPNFFLNISEILAESNLDLAVNLLTNLLEVLEKQDELEEAIFVSKKILALDEFNLKIRQKLLDLYRFKYASNPQLEECLKGAGFFDNDTKLENAVKKFEKEILFTEGSYVHHRSWDIGKITSITDGEFLIDFDDKKEHKMSYAMALKSLTPLAADHIWVLKKKEILQKEKEELDAKAYQVALEVEKKGKEKEAKSKKAEDDEESKAKVATRYKKEVEAQWMERVLLSVLKSFPEKSLSGEDFKEELVPVIIEQDKWNAWWNKAKNVLKLNKSVGTLKEGRPRYILKNVEESFQDELMKNFFQSKKFEEKLKIYEECVKEDITGEEYEDQFKEMIAYFMEVVESPRFDFNERLISYVLLKIKARSGSSNVQEIPGNPQDFMEDLEELIWVLKENYRPEYKKEILNIIELHHAKPKEVFQEILWNDRGTLASHIMNKLTSFMEKKDIGVLMNEAFNNQFRYNPYLAFWFFEYLLKDVTEENPRYAKFGFNLPDLYMDALYRVDTLGKLVSQKKLNWFQPPLFSADAKKLTTQADDLLFKNNFENFLLNDATEEYAIKVYHLIKTTPGISQDKKNQALKAIYKKYPSIDVSGDEDAFIKEIAIDYYEKDVIWSTAQGLTAQHKKIDQLKEEKRLNIIELDKAREKGDLKENAEYQAAREKDTNLNNEIAQLGNQISMVKIIDTTQLTGERVAPGTEVTFLRNGKKEKYTILGFWDTNEKKHILAYDAPLARAIMGSKKDEMREVEIGGEKVALKILDIKVKEK